MTASTSIDPAEFLHDQLATASPDLLRDTFVPGSDLPVIDDFDELVALVERKPGMYLRYSAGPAADAENGSSRDHEAEVDLPGSAAE